MEYTIVNCFSAIIEYFALYAFLWIFFELDSDKSIWRKCCHIIMPVLFLLFSNSIDNMYLRPALFILCSCFIAQGFQGDFWHRIFSISVFQIILVLLEITISLTLQPVAGLSMESFYLAGNIFIRLITIAILIVLFLVSRKRQRIFSHLQTSSVLMLLLFSGMSLFLVTFSEYLLLRLNEPYLYSIGCVGILLCIFANVILYYLFSQLSTGEEAKAHLKLIDFHLSHKKAQQTYLDRTYREIRKISHDMNRYLSAIYSLLSQNKVNEAMEELKKQQLEIVQNQLFDTGYPLLNSVLSYKIQLAQEQNIQTQLFWHLLSPLHLNLTDLAVILSNGLDNAIEAAVSVTESKPFISISAETKGEYIIITICNNTAVQPKIVNGTISTTKKEKHLHGLGLESIQRLAQQYSGDSFIECQDKIFTLTVILKNTSVTAETSEGN